MPCASPRPAAPPPPPAHPPPVVAAGADAANNADLLNALFGDDPAPVPAEFASPDPKRRRAVDGGAAGLPPLSSGPLTPIGLHAPRAPSSSPGAAAARVAGRRRPTRLLPFTLVAGGGRPAVGGSGAAPALADLNARLRAAAAASARVAAAAAAAAVGLPVEDAPATPQAAGLRAPATPATPAGVGAPTVRPTLLCGPGASPAASIRVSRVASCVLGPPAP